MALTAPPPAVLASDTPAVFDAKAYARVQWEATNVAEATALQIDVNAKQATTTAAALAAQADRLLCAAAQAAVTAQSPVANAAAAADSAAAAAVYASLAQATNPNSPIRLNPRRITANFTVPSDANAASVGPITVADGVTVTVADNATWSIH